jgi:hypothetical protein
VDQHQRHDIREALLDIALAAWIVIASTLLAALLG